jgi:outer membrane protein
MRITAYVSMCSLICFGLLSFPPGIAHSQQVIDLTLERAVDIAMKNSYQVQQLQMGIERTRHNLKAQEAGLKSRVSMNLSVPSVNSTSDYRWNSYLQKDEIVHTNTRRVQMDLSVRQPVILFGYPTNGYLSLNNKMYQYLQKYEGRDPSKDYYNRYYISFDQPLFVPNELKNDLEQSRLSLESEELRYITNIVSMMDDIAGDYYRLFRLAYQQQVYGNHVETLQQISDIIQSLALVDTTRALEALQVQVELTNTKDRLSQNQVDLRLRIADMKQQLMLSIADSVFVTPKMKEIKTIQVDTEKAITYGYELQPRLRQLDITRRRNEISLDETKASNAFRMNLGMTYGLEKQDEDYGNLWEEQDNSYSLSVSAYVPIWDWGQRKERIDAAKITLRQNDLSMKETRERIAMDIANAISNLEEYQRRAIAMRDNVEVSRNLTQLSIEQYRMNNISITNLLTIVNSTRDSEINFVDTYLNWRESILNLKMNTYYDYELDKSLLDVILEQQNIGVATTSDKDAEQDT